MANSIPIRYLSYDSLTPPHTGHPSWPSEAKQDLPCLDVLARTAEQWASEASSQLLGLAE